MTAATDDHSAVVAALKEGRLAIFATETLWSLSARADDPRCAKMIFEAKGRPEGVPLAIGFSSWLEAAEHVLVTPLAERLAAEYLPGPLSLVLERRERSFPHAAPGLTTLSIRIPDHEVAKRVLAEAGPCIMTSANRHGERDAISRADVQSAFPDVPVVGSEVKGLASTVVDARGEHPVVLREGAITF